MEVHDEEKDCQQIQYHNCVYRAIHHWNPCYPSMCVSGANRDCLDTYGQDCTDTGAGINMLTMKEQ